MQPTFYWSMDNAQDARGVDNGLATSVWPSCGAELKCWTASTVGVNEGGLYSDGTSAGRMTLSSGNQCPSSPVACVNGLFLAFWLRHEIKTETGQTFFAAGSPERNETGFRIFQFKGISTDHLAFQLVLELSNCIWTFRAPQKIWSHFVIRLGPKANNFDLFLNGEKHIHFDKKCTSGNFQNGPMGLWIGDHDSGFPHASYDDVILLQDPLSEDQIKNIFQFYHGM